jgi:endonuclease/exonuclease/phosphatase family metal-dependent hydrolase
MNALYRYRRGIELPPIAIAAIALVISIATSVAAAAPFDINVMSFNVRYSRGGPQEPATENDWNDPKFPRRERAVQVIRDTNPDLLGVQEARDLQIEHLREALPRYEFYGIGRDDGKTGGEFSGIFFLKERFTQKDAGSFWLSATPEKPGTSFYTAPKAVPRIASWVRLLDNKANREFVFLNMHWDNNDKTARVKSAALVRSRLLEIAKDVPLIVAGDLNTSEDGREYTGLIGIGDPSGRELVDSYRAVFPQRKPDESTFNHWQGTTEGSRIDFILATPEFTPSAARIIRTAYDGRWPSDHYPISATLRIESE